MSYCQQNSITVIAYSPLAVGMRNISRRDRVGNLSRVAAETGHTEAQVALNWCISKENVIAIPKAQLHTSMWKRTAPPLAGTFLPST